MSEQQGATETQDVATEVAAEENERPLTAKVAIGIPTTGLVHAGFMMDFLRMALYTRTNYEKVDFMPFMAEGTNVYQGREMIADAALRAGATHVLWLDSDMRFPADTLGRLLKAAPRAIVGANYAERRPPFRPSAIRTWDEIDLRVYTTEDDHGYERVAGVGHGVLLVDRIVYEKMPRPWYLVGYNKAAHAHMTEDHYFCFQAKRHGFFVNIDHDLSRHVGHTGTNVFSLEDSLGFAAAHPEALQFAPDVKSVPKPVTLLAPDGQPVSSEVERKLVVPAGAKA